MMLTYLTFSRSRNSFNFLTGIPCAFLVVLVGPYSILVGNQACVGSRRYKFCPYAAWASGCGTVLTLVLIFFRLRYACRRFRFSTLLDCLLIRHFTLPACFDCLMHYDNWREAIQHLFAAGARAGLRLSKS